MFFNILAMLEYNRIDVKYLNIWENFAGIDGIYFETIIASNKC